MSSDLFSVQIKIFFTSFLDFVSIFQVIFWHSTLQLQSQAHGISNIKYRIKGKPSNVWPRCSRNNQHTRWLLESIPGKESLLKNLPTCPYIVRKASSTKNNDDYNIMISNGGQSTKKQIKLQIPTLRNKWLELQIWTLWNWKQKFESQKNSRFNFFFNLESFK